MGRGDLTNAQWARIEVLLPKNGQGGRGGTWLPHRRLINGIRYRARVGCPWRDLPRGRFGPWQTVYERFNKWSKDGTWARILAALQQLDEVEGAHDHSLWCIDGSMVRAQVSAAGAPKGGPRSLRTTHLASPEVDGPQSCT